MRRAIGTRHKPLFIRPRRISLAEAERRIYASGVCLRSAASATMEVLKEHYGLIPDRFKGNHYNNSMAVWPRFWRRIREKSLRIERGQRNAWKVVMLEPSQDHKMGFAAKVLIATGTMGMGMGLGIFVYNLMR